MPSSRPEDTVQYFTKEVSGYITEYLRGDERFVVDHFFHGKRLLVLGCGAGRTLRPLHERGFEVTAIDLTPAMVEEAKKAVNGLPIQVFEMNAAKLDFPNDSFDVVFFPFHGIDYVLPDIYAAVREAQRVLTPEGSFIFSSHNRFFLKKLPRFFEGTRANYAGLDTYRTTPLDWFRLKQFFSNVKMIQRVTIATSWKDGNWKDRLYKIFSLLDKSTYFICIKKK